MPIIEARNKLTSLPEQFEREPQIGALAVTRHGKPVLAIMPWEFYEAITETLELLGDPVLMAAFRQGAQEARDGRTVPWEQVKAQLDK